MIKKEIRINSCAKINEKLDDVIDAVNKLHEEAENNARIRADHENLIDTLVAENNIHERQIDELQMKVNKLASNIDFAKPEVKDKFAESRKWIGKLCWFWNNDNEPDTCFGVLTGLFDEADRPFERSMGQQLYRYCEPVKPDDDIIYRGE